MNMTSFRVYRDVDPDHAAYGPKFLCIDGDRAYLRGKLLPLNPPDTLVLLRLVKRVDETVPFCVLGPGLTHASLKAMVCRVRSALRQALPDEVEILVVANVGYRLVFY